MGCVPNIVIFCQIKKIKGMKIQVNENVKDKGNSPQLE